MTPLFAIFAPLLVAYAITLSWCVDRWNAETQYFEHCWLVPLIGFAVVWSRRKDWRKRPRTVDLGGLWLLVPGLLLHLLGAALMIDSWSAASLALTVPGAAWLALGRQRLTGLWPLLWLVLFAIPMPLYVEGRLAFVLKEFAVTGGSFVANLLGADVTRTVDRLQPNGIEGSLYVADACGGLRSLLAMLTLGYCLAFFTGPANVTRRVILLLLSAPLAITANVVRIASLCLMARWFGVPFAEGTGHTIANIVEWGALIVSLVLVDGLFARRVGKTLETATVPEIRRDQLELAVRSLRWPAVVLWVLCAPLLWLCSYRPFGEQSDRAARLPATIGGYSLRERNAEQQRSFDEQRPRYRELLGTDDFVWRTYENDQQRRVYVVALFHDSNWKSVHPPRICIEGSNMEIERDDLVSTPWLGDHKALGRIVARRRSDQWRFVTLSAYGTATWASGDYWQFALHHLPLALLRQSESGFLLRVESPVYRGEHPAAAERRSDQFMQQLLPMAQELVR